MKRRRPDEYLKSNPKTLILIVLCTIPFAGCGGQADTTKYTPSDDTARQSLEMALNAWKLGGQPGKVDGPPINLQVVDSKREDGQTLANYEIVAEVPGESAGKRFLVRLQLSNPAEERETHYVVVGIDPVWVFGEDDYSQTRGM